MTPSTRSRSRLALAVVLIGLVGLGVAHWAARPKPKSRLADIDALIDQLSEPANKVKVIFHIIPGGEVLKYSPPMTKLISLGDVAREPLHRRLGDEQIQNEVVLILGAIGDD